MLFKLGEEECYLISNYTFHCGEAALAWGHGDNL